MPDLDHDRLLALSYVPAQRRPALEALWRLDVALGAVLAGGREPMISRIKLVWWRDALEALDSAPTRGEPALEAAARHILPAGVTGAALSGMEEGWAHLLSPEALTPEELAGYAQARGGLLFRHSAILLGGETSPELEAAGEAWALVDLARHSTESADVDAALAAARARTGPHCWPPALRPLGMLAALARRDAEPDRPRWEPHGAPRRMLRMLRHRLTGH